MWRGYTGRVGIRRLVFTVSECDTLPLEWALGRIYSFGWGLYSTGCPKWRKRAQRYSVLTQVLPTPSTNMFKPFLCTYGEWDFGCLHLCWMVPTRLSHCKSGRDSGQMRQKRCSVDKEQCWEGSSWRICKSLLLINGYSHLWQEMPGEQT